MDWVAYIAVGVGGALGIWTGRAAMSWALENANALDVYESHKANFNTRMKEAETALNQAAADYECLSVTSTTERVPLLDAAKATKTLLRTLKDTTPEKVKKLDYALDKFTNFASEAAHDTPFDPGESVVDSVEAVVSAGEGWMGGVDFPPVPWLLLLGFVGAIALVGGGLAYLLSSPAKVVSPPLPPPPPPLPPPPPPPPVVDTPPATPAEVDVIDQILNTYLSETCVLLIGLVVTLYRLLRSK